MKIKVGKKSVIARNINRILWIINFISLDIIYFKYLGYNDSDEIILLFAIFILILLIVNVIDLVIGVHYYKKTTTTITGGEIIQTTYRFPYSKNIQSIIASDITGIKVEQSSINRILGCGDIIIKGYSNSNYSKTKFSITIYGVDNVLNIKDEIIEKFKALR